MGVTSIHYRRDQRRSVALRKSRVTNSVGVTLTASRDYAFLVTRSPKTDDGVGYMIGLNGAVNCRLLQSTVC